MTLIDGDRTITAQLYDDEHEEFIEKKMSIIDYINAYTDEGVTTADVVDQPRWIPVSERLPKQNGWHQCTVVINDLPRTIELFYKNGKWLDNRRIDMLNTYDIYGYGNTKEKHKLSYQELISEFDWTENVIAWQLLSEPYKAEGEDR